MHRDVATVREKAALFCGDMSSMLSKILDLTYPYTSMFSGASFNRGIQSIFKDQQIEVTFAASRFKPVYSTEPAKWYSGLGAPVLHNEDLCLAYRHFTTCKNCGSFPTSVEIFLKHAILNS